MNKSSNELLHRYFLGSITEDEVRELEARLLADDHLQDEFLCQAEVDAHLRQEAQAVTTTAVADDSPVQQSSTIWMWISGVSTLAATILVAIVFFNMPPQRTALAYPSLGNLVVYAASNASVGKLHRQRHLPTA
jgi:anti-sigma factor RsiW